MHKTMQTCIRFYLKSIYGASRARGQKGWAAEGVSGGAVWLAAAAVVVAVVVAVVMVVMTIMMITMMSAVFKPTGWQRVVPDWCE